MPALVGVNIAFLFYVKDNLLHKSELYFEHMFFFNKI